MTKEKSYKSSSRLQLRSTMQLISSVLHEVIRREFNNERYQVEVKMCDNCVNITVSLL